MPNSLQVSVIVPVFQDQLGLEACLAALELQNFPRDEFEVIVVDNGSTPPIHVTSHHTFKLDVVRCASPGSYAARNAGVARAAGRILALTDADCRPRPDWLEEGVKVILQREGRVVVGGEVLLEHPPHETAVSLYQSICGFQQKENIESKRFSVTANIFVPSNSFAEVGPFDETLFSGGDREWCWRAGEAGITVVFAPLAIVDTDPRSTLGSAITQARRVAAGRRSLIRGAPRPQDAWLAMPHRSALQAACWLVRHPRLPYSKLVPVLFVACVLRLAAALEVLRVRLGMRAERR